MFTTMASSEFAALIKARKLDAGLLKRLNVAGKVVNQLIDDAEEKHLTDDAIRNWVAELKDAAYEVDDFIDELGYEAIQAEVEAASQTATGKMLSFFSYRNPFKDGINGRLKKLLERLDGLIKQNDVHKLSVDSGNRQSSSIAPSTSLVQESCVYGREGDKNAIMNLLLLNDRNSDDLGVITIVGTGGVGKTTLAKLIHNDSKVQEHFQISAWVCVSEDFDVNKITKDILEELSGKAADNRTLNQLQIELKGRLTQKKFLIILDDVWNENDHDWDLLQTPLKYGAKGSKIIATTRNLNVASIMSTTDSYHLNPLTNDDCWVLFSNCASVDGSIDTLPELETIGREIVGKCEGLPLATKILGALLHSEQDVEIWKKILSSTLWNLDDNILPALILSYHYLPSYLKQCFAYCAIFPKDYKFQKEELVLLWMSEGFISQMEGEKEIEELACEYFDQLVARSFFQQSSGLSSCFTMHGLIHDLSEYVSGEFCFQLDGNDLSKITKRTRHLRYARTSKDASRKIEDIYRARVLRTFFSSKAIWWNVDYKSIDNDVINGLLSTLSNLRVLSFYGYNLVELPNSIGNLKHLRYLNLSLTCVKELPAMICTLYNLQILIMQSCKELEVLPDSIGKLKQLQHLDLCQTAIGRLPDSVVLLTNLYHLDLTETKLQEMPLQLGKLTKLQCLTDFVVGKRSGASIKELEELHHLRETIRIWNLQNVVDSADTFGALLKRKKHLKRLELRWHGDADDSSHEVMLMEKLQPYLELNSLKIDGYRGTTFPVWVGDSAFTHIISVELIGCKNCYFLPSLGQLPSLEKLSIKAFDSIRAVGSEFCVSVTSMEMPFRSLRTLEFEDMPEWEEWTPFVEESEGGRFPLLEELCLTNCPKLKQTLPSHLPSLQLLRIRGCQLLRIASLPSDSVVFRMEARDMLRMVMLETSTAGLHSVRVNAFGSKAAGSDPMEPVRSFSPSLEEIDIEQCLSVKCLPLEMFPQLKSLAIKNCQNMESLSSHEECLDELVSLSSLKISECPRFASFPKGGLPAPNLTNLTLLTCSNLTCLPECMDSRLPSLVELTVSHCPEIESFPEGGLPSKLQTLKICACDKLVAGHSQWDLQSLPSLVHFSMDSNKGLNSFPKETLLPSTLITLRISSIQDLKSLDDKGIQHLTCIKELKISACPNLESFPVGDLFPTLESLEINDCDKLIAGRSQWNLQAITSLLHLKFFENDEVESFPAVMLLPSSLISVEIWDLYSLKSLEGLQQLTSLRKLKISRCPELYAIPEEGLPSSLSSLTILRCPFLEQRCQQDKGEDWSKISHITNLEIGYYNI
ncbi:Putative disease resistance RPP13-like protein 1 [Linum grandiflorum]